MQKDATRGAKSFTAEPQRDEAATKDKALSGCNGDNSNMHVNACIYEFGQKKVGLLFLDPAINETIGLPPGKH